MVALICLVCFYGIQGAMSLRYSVYLYMWQRRCNIRQTPEETHNIILHSAGQKYIVSPRKYTVRILTLLLYYYVAISPQINKALKYESNYKIEDRTVSFKTKYVRLLKTCCIPLTG